MSDLSSIFGANFSADKVLASDIGSGEGYAPVPAGWYQAMIKQPSNGEMVRDSKAGGKYLKVCYSIIGPRASGRMVFDNVNILVKPRDDSEDARRKANAAMEIGHRMVAKLCKAIGRATLTDSSELVDAVVWIRVVVSERRNLKGELENEVKDVSGRAPAAAKSPAPAANPVPSPAVPAAPAAAAGKLPWMK